MMVNPLPDGWRTMPIGKIGKVVTGNTPPKADELNYGSDVPWVSPIDMGAGKYITSTKNSLSADGARLARLVPAGSVLVTCIASIGKNAIASRALCTNQQINAVVVDESHCNEYIYYCIEHHGVPLLQKYAGRTAVPIVSKGLFEQLELPFPKSKVEQQKIAAILTAVDDKLDVIARQIEATQTLKQGLMQTLFSRGVGTQDTDGRWVPHAELKDSELGEIPASWAVKPLEALAHSITVGIATSTTEHYVQDGVPLIRNQNIKEDFLDMSDLLQISAEFDAKNKSKRVEGGDILTVRTGYPGVSCVVPDGLGRLQTFTTLITRPNRQLVNAHFVSRYFNSPQGKGLMLHQAAGGAQQNINAGNLKKLLVPVPSISEQERIAAVLAALDEKLRSLSSRSEHCQNLKRGLMQKLLTGEWRVSVDANALSS